MVIVKKAKIFFFALLVLILLLVSWVGYGLSTSMRAEETLHAYKLVADLVCVYLNEQGGKWPKDWDGLLAIEPSRTHGVWDWPEESEQVIKRLELDFSVTTAQVAAMKVETLDVIKQQWPHYEHDHYWSARLLEAAKRWHVRNQNVTNH